MAGLSLSLWVLQPLVAGRLLGLGGMRVAYTIIFMIILEPDDDSEMLNQQRRRQRKWPRTCYYEQANSH